MLSDTYYSIKDKTEGIYKEKGSKFLSFAFPVSKETEIQQILKELKKQHHSARHHCYAFRLGAENERIRFNDDGEPSNSAGKPILGEILSKDLTDILVVVVRYFGGTLLGIGGLVHAYKKATEDALHRADIIHKTINNTFRVVFSYADTKNVMKIVNEEKIILIDKDFSENCTAKIAVRKSESERIIKRFNAIQNVKTESIDT